jgi:hypothetical protein
VKPRRGAAVALVCGLGLLAVVGAAIAFRKDIAAAWHLHRLRTDEDYLETIIEEPEGSAADLAIRRHLKTSEGKNALFLLHGMYMSEHHGSFVFTCGERHVCRGVVWLGKEHFHSESQCNRGRSAARTVDVPRLRAAARYLPLLEGTEFRWPDEPALRLHVIPKARAADLLGQPNLDPAGADPWVWWFKRLHRPSAALAR